METTPNPVEKAFDAAPVAPTGEETFDRTVSTTEAEPTVDYKEKFSASSREAQRLASENAEKDAEIARLKALGETREPGTASESLYPGFEQLSEEEQKNLLGFAHSVEEKVKAGISNDPAIAHSRRVYNEKKFDDAFAAVSATYPELNQSKEEFKTKYFQPNNTPDNIETILGDLAKVHLFDRERAAGAEEERTKQDRIDQERTRGGGEQAPTTSRSLSEWQAIARDNPAKFALMKKDYEADLASGKLGE